MMVLTETLTGIYGPIADLDVVTELNLDDKHPRDLLTLFREYNVPTKVPDQYRTVIKGVEYYSDYRTAFSFGEPRNYTSQDSCFKQFLAELRACCND
jgi:hypothetical protein